MVTGTSTCPNISSSFSLKPSVGRSGESELLTKPKITCETSIGDSFTGTTFKREEICFWSSKRFVSKCLESAETGTCSNRKDLCHP
jgi:hypothetical protein